MPVTVIWTCTCGTKVATPANRVGRRYVCPVCSRAGTVPPDGRWQAAPSTASPSRKALSLLAASLVILIGLQTLSILNRDGYVPPSIIATAAASFIALFAALFLERRRSSLPSTRQKQPSTATG